MRETPKPGHVDRVGISILALAVLAGCAHRGPYEPRSEAMKLETWPSPETPDDYPERDAAYGFDYLWDRPSFGLAFSGGGTRSASATWGQLRGLEELGWLERARYLSSVSGGTWTALPFTYLPPGDCDSGGEADCDRLFLEAHVPPGDLERGNLTHFPSGSFGRTLSRTPIVGLFLSRFLIRSDETYGRALGKRFLKRLGLYECDDPLSESCDPPPKHRYLLADEAQWERLHDRGTELLRRDFVTMRPGRPFLVAGSSLLAKKRFAKRDWDFFPVEITPLYAGVPQPLTAADGGEFGKGWIESPGLDARSYVYEGCDGPHCSGIVEVDRPVKLGRGVRHRFRFTPSDALGASGAAPVRVIRAFGWNLIGFPEFRYAPIGTAIDKAPEFAFGDGGHIDNLGLVPLLARETRHILVFVNAQTRFGRRPGKGDLAKVFQARWLKLRDGREASQAGEEGWQPLLQPEGLERINGALTELQQTGHPLTYCGTFETLDNPRLGISVYRPNVCWVHLDRSGEWIDRLPTDHRLFRQLRKPRPRPFTRFYRFPHYSTFFHRFFKLRVIDLSEEQVNALAHLTSWTVLESALAVARCFGFPEPDDPSEVARTVARHSGACGGHDG